MHIPYNDTEINIMVHDKIMEQEACELFPPPYISDLEEAWRVAQKVNLFESIIIVKQKNSPAWIAYRKGIEQPLLFGEEENRPVDFLNMEPIALGYSFPEAICRASLVLKEMSNERTERSDQHGFSLFETVDP
jgi:hypothetical protein